MKVQISSGDIHLFDIHTRMPFRYGIVTMTRSPHAFVRLQVQVNGQSSTGVAADHLPPKWFTKDPNRDIDAEIIEMLGVIEHALTHALGIAADSPFDAWRELYRRHDEWGCGQQLPSLLTHFGTSLVERAMIDAVCRQARCPFHELLRGDQLGIRLGEIHPQLAGQQPSEHLPAHPLSTIIARHTVGLVDAISPTEIAANERLDDGLPQTLIECIQTYGLRHFKIKISGLFDNDCERLIRIADAISHHAPADFAFTLDGNEQFPSMAAFRAYWEAVRQTHELASFFSHLLFVEQPVHRTNALHQDATAKQDWPERPPLIIDESDGELASLPQALQLGYNGTSHKNCKGVFKGIANACLLMEMRRQHPDRRFIISGEDLANIGPVALLQDLAVNAALGIASVERNGHHYFAGLSMFPAAVQTQLLEAHSDLYRASARGWPTLDIGNGLIRLDSINHAPFGFQPLLDVEAFDTLADWNNLHRDIKS